MLGTLPSHRLLETGAARPQPVSPTVESTQVGVLLAVQDQRFPVTPRPAKTAALLLGSFFVREPLRGGYAGYGKFRNNRMPHRSPVLV